ncbi:MAG: hypothetical protein FJ207_03245 [Gemmatimonadetes bacterium]|nr:hypothetical protein [Gemmatimonadota bacterium]
MTDTTDAPIGAQQPAPPQQRRKSLLQRIVMTAVAAACFVYLYLRVDSAAGRAGMSLVDYMADVFANVAWLPWLFLMMAYSFLYFAIDTMVITSAVGWFIKRIPFRDIMPIRASAYIISIFNEQIGKGAMAWYLYRRDRVPGWEVGSVMLFIMFCEMFYLGAWATVGYFITRDELPDAFDLIPSIAVGAVVFFILWLLYFEGKLLPGSKLRERSILHAFRQARLRHYVGFFLLRSPALLSAVFVYSTALGFFGVETSVLSLIGYLPVIFFAATIPTPMRAAAITSWVVLFPANEGQMAAFGLLQHNFFIFFNALIGLVFLPRAQRELADK